MSDSANFSFPFKRTEDRSGVWFQVEFPQGYAYFNGHFPNRPVLPAVATLEVMEILIGTLTSKQVRLSEVRRARYKGMITPEEMIHIHVEPEGDTYHASWYRDGAVEELVVDLDFRVRH